MSKRVPITCAADLLKALESTDFALQSAVMQMISKDPVKALGYGSHEGRDVVDVLIVMGSVMEARLALLPCTTLAVFHDPRVVDFFLDRLEHGQGKVVALATGYLMRCEIRRERVYQTVMGNESRLHVRAAARLLGPPMPNDPPEVALRLALLLPDCTLPPLGGSWEQRWIDQLESLVAAEARAGLEGLSEGDTLPRMLTHWAELSRDNQRWLLEWGAGRDPEKVLEQFREALSTEPAWALRLLRRLPDALALLREDLPLDHADPRIANWACSLVGLDPRVDISNLEAALGSPDWRIRAETCEALLAKGGSDVVLAVRPLATSDRLEIRAAAAQILMALGDHEWMEETLLAPLS